MNKDRGTAERFGDKTSVQLSAGTRHARIRDENGPHETTPQCEAGRLAGIEDHVLGNGVLSPFAPAPLTNMPALVEVREAPTTLIDTVAEGWNVDERRIRPRQGNCAESLVIHISVGSYLTWWCRG